MKWLYEKQRMKDKIKKISGLRFTFLSLFHLVLLSSTHLGKHFSVGIGMGSLEIATQFSNWSFRGKREQEWTDVGIS
jgi:hypothetical protein